MGKKGGGGGARGAKAASASKGLKAGKLARRQARTEQRREAAARKRGGVRLDRFAGHDEKKRKESIKRRLEVQRLTNAVKRQEELLLGDQTLATQVANLGPGGFVAPSKRLNLTLHCSGNVPVEEPVKVDPVLKAKRRKRDFYDLDTSHWKLRGAARPASEVFAPPENPHEKLIGSGEDLFESQAGRFWEKEQCREYLRLLRDKGEAQRRGGKPKAAIESLKKCLELDPLDNVMARRALVLCYMDTSEADQARKLLEKFPEDTSCAVCYSLAAIEYISFYLLQEEGSSANSAEAALSRAHDSNPFVAWQLAHLDIFNQVVEHVEDMDKSPLEGSVEEAIAYSYWDMGLWDDLDGVCDWVRDWLAKHGHTPPAPRTEPENPIYLRMFETMCNMALEAEEERIAQEQLEQPESDQEPELVPL
ncbi:unnamed protein product [Chrysoparadoxa australica]